MSLIPSFDIHPNGEISIALLERNIFTFSDAANYIRHLPYRRNINKDKLLSLFIEQCGTCSSKHALLKLLSEENNFKGLKLMVGIFKMNAVNTPKLKVILEQNQLDYLPEAHCYLRYNNQIIDHTSKSSNPNDFITELIEEIEINVNEISTYKVLYHKKHLTSWLLINPQLKLSLDEIWGIREQCILALSN